MPEQQEWIFYEAMWRNEARRRRMPIPWWMQQYFRRWVDDLDTGLFDSKEAAFCSNALYRYWNMVGVKNAHQECLIGQAGEVQPVYDKYSINFFLFDPQSHVLHFPQFPDFTQQPAALTQQWQDNHLPVLITTYRAANGLTVEQRVLATTVGVDQKSTVLVRLLATAQSAGIGPAWLCIGINAAGPAGFRRHDRARSFVDPRWLQWLRYRTDESLVEVNQHIGPIFDCAPDRFGIYGNGQAADPDLYLKFNPYEELRARGDFNGFETATDYFGGFCQGALAWNLNLPNAGDTFSLDIRLPVDDFQGQGDLAVLRQPTADNLEQNNRVYWTNLLDNNRPAGSASDRGVAPLRCISCVPCDAPDSGG